MEKNYSEYYEQLQNQIRGFAKENSGVMKGMGQLHHAAISNGALSTATKELIAVGIGIAARCDGCITLHVKDALKAGATREEIVETIGVSVLMGGGPALMYGVQALEALKQFDQSYE